MDFQTTTDKINRLAEIETLCNLIKDQIIPGTTLTGIVLTEIIMGIKNQTSEIIMKISLDQNQTMRDLNAKYSKCGTK